MYLDDDDCYDTNDNKEKKCHNTFVRCNLRDEEEAEVKVNKRDKRKLQINMNRIKKK